VTPAGVVGLAAAALFAAAAAVEFARPACAGKAWLALARAAGRLRPRRLAVGGLDVPYLDGGAGEPLVLVHGFGGDKDNFTRIAPHLTRHFRVIAPDLAGFGESTRDPSLDYRVSAQVDRLHAFIGALGFRRVHLGGSSMGGFIVAEYAARHPDEVASLWLLDPAGTEAALDTPMLREYLRSGEIPLLVREASAYRDLLAAVTHRPLLAPPSLKRLLAARAVADFPLHERIFREVRRESPLLEPRLATIVAPTLIVWGSEDQVLSPAAAAVLGRGIERNEIEMMDGVGHLPMLERPAACARRYLEFRTRIARRAESTARREA